ncbi:type II secretion system F family protein [Actinomadura alba]|uniref:Type II secretion system F family protein n=1 Tax=Actinomadura alba TaxID=406431 RepID=A0ABR7M2D3_9ACTN|nr:type II secretion system F family protein [Actinomadura alba]MBC6470847.1 type II secretion system F family protein [Actinomadura alba]
MTGLGALAALCTGTAVWSLTTPSPAVLRLREMLIPRTPPWPRRVAVRAVAAFGELRRRRGETRLRRAAVIELCDGIAAELAAGRTPAAAFAESAAVLDPAVGSVLLAARPGEGIPGLLDRMAGAPGAEGLRLLAACWRIGAERGGALASVIQSLSDSLREEEAHRREVTAQLAGPRATARLLAGLPLLGLGMAAALGARPLAFLFGTPPGAACLLAGIGLDVLGLWWTQRLAATAGSPR